MKGHHLHEMNILAAATLAITWTAAFAVFAATAALALCVTDANAATLSPTTAHDDIPGDATLKEIVEGAGATEELEAEAKERKAADAALVGSLSDLSDALNEESKLQCDAINAVSSDLSDHAADADNPHGVTAAQVGALSVTKEDYTLFGIKFTRTLADSTLMWRGIYFGTNTNVEIDYTGVYAKSFPTNDEKQITLTALRPWGFMSYDRATKTTNEFCLPDKGGTLLTSESDPKFKEWKENTNVALGQYASARLSDKETGETFTRQIAVGPGARTEAQTASAFGADAYAGVPYSVAFAVAPTNFWLNSRNTAVEPGKTARSLQSYLDERVPWSTFTNSVLDVAGKSSASEKKYPLFIIRLNEDAASPKFSDIELKATTNNYATFESMTFFAGTAVNGLDSSDYGFTPDWCRIYVLSSKVDGDVRRWRRIRNTTDLGEYKPGDFAIIVDPAMFRRGQGDGWCSDQNEELTWSFVRLGSGAEDDAEKDADGTSQLWRPIMPVKWYSKLPAWADQKEYGAAN